MGAEKIPGRLPNLPIFVAKIGKLGNRPRIFSAPTVQLSFGNFFAQTEGLGYRNKVLTQGCIRQS
jgi:hypothetical protein